MQKSTFRTLIELLIMIVVLFGWITMLYTGYSDLTLQDSEGSKTSEASRFNPLRYGFQIFLVGTLALVFVSRRRVLNERVAMGVITNGQVGNH